MTHQNTLLPLQTTSIQACSQWSVIDFIARSLRATLTALLIRPTTPWNPSETMLPLSRIRGTIVFERWKKGKEEGIGRYGGEGEKRGSRGKVGRMVSRVETGLIKGRNRHKSWNGEETKNRSKLDSVRVSKRVEIKTRLSFTFSSCWNARDAFEKRQLSLFLPQLSLGSVLRFYFLTFLQSLSIRSWLNTSVCVCVCVCMSGE